MRRKLSKLVSPAIAALLLAALLLSPAVTSGQKKPDSGNCGACARRAYRACEGSEDPRGCWEQYFYENCVAFFGCTPQQNPF